MSLSSIEDAIEAYARGEFLIVVTTRTVRTRATSSSQPTP